MKNILFLFSINIIILTACSPKGVEVERVSMRPTIIYDSIETRMPGKLLLCGQYIIWTDPLSGDSQAHIVSLNTNNEIGKIVNIGNGPEEFITPFFTSSSHNKLVVCDMNRDKTVYFSLDSIKQKKNPLTSISSLKTEGATRIVEIENNSFITLNTNTQYPFLLNNDKYFGKHPFVEKINNNNNVSQGNIAYNPNNGYFIYSTILFPYMAAYQKKENSFELVWEKRGDIDYTITENKVNLNKNKTGAPELTLTKDYIVTLQRDYLNDPTDETKVGRDFTKTPQTLFLYDYDSNLRKIIHLKLPILRVTSHPENNTIYAIVLDSEFVLIKCELPNLL